MVADIAKRTQYKRRSKNKYQTCRITFFVVFGHFRPEFDIFKENKMATNFGMNLPTAVGNQFKLIYFKCLSRNNDISCLIKIRKIRITSHSSLSHTEDIF